VTGSPPWPAVLREDSSTGRGLAVLGRRPPLAHGVAFHEIGVQLEFESTSPCRPGGPDQREVRPLQARNNVLACCFEPSSAWCWDRYRGRGDVDEMPHLRCFRCRRPRCVCPDVDRAEQLAFSHNGPRQMIDDIDPHERPRQGRGLVTSPWWISAASPKRLTSGSPAEPAPARDGPVGTNGAMREPISPAAPGMRMVIGKSIQPYTRVCLAARGATPRRSKTLISGEVGVLGCHPSEPCARFLPAFALLLAHLPCRPSSPRRTIDVTARL